MTIRYDFNGYKYDFDVPFEAMNDIFKKHYPEIDDWLYWIQFEKNENHFEREWADYLKHMFKDEALEEAKEQAMDPYEYYGVSRNMFY
jgi:hypothetical protein